MSRIIAIANVKGGVGKTTTAANLSAALAERGRRVLAVDLDPQASLTLTLGFKVTELSKTISDVLTLTASSIPSVLVQTAENFDLVPANHDLRATEHELENGHIRVFAVRSALEPLRIHYDYILLDCPANAGILTGNALAAADELIVPFPADYLALQALSWFLQVVKEMKKKVNPCLRVAGLFLSAYDPRVRHAREIIAEAQQTYGIDMPFFTAAARHTVVVKQASRAGQSLLRFAPDSNAAQAYRALALEVEEGIQEGEPGDAPAFVRRGRVALTAGDVVGAYTAFCSATSLAPEMVEAWVGRAKASSEWDEAMRSYAEALALKPPDPEAREGLERGLNGNLGNSGLLDIPTLMGVARFLTERGLDSFAERIFRKVTELDADHEEAWLGQAHTSQDLRVKIQHLEQALKINPNNNETQKELELTKERLRAQADSLAAEAEALARNGERQRAHALFGEATALDPRNDRAWVGCARTTDSLDEALYFVKQALQARPDNAEARELHSWLWSPETGGGVPTRSALRIISLLLAALVVLASIVFLALNFLR